MSFINSDSRPKEDLLNRKRFADEIASSMLVSFENGEDSFVFGLNGKWGSGKTTLMDYLQEALIDKLGDSKKHIIFDFNPWMFSGRDELLLIFLKELSRLTGGASDAFKDVVEGLSDAVSYFGWVKYLSATAGGWQKGVKDQLTTLSSAPSIRELKDKVDDAIVGNQLRLFIFIDDLDRLTPREVVEVFQIIKLNANFKNTIFVVAYDKEVVQQIITKEYGFNGERYLEKIVQVDYRVPDLLDETIQVIFLNQLKEFCAKIEVDIDLDEIRGIWTVHRLKYFFTTLRDIYRYFNALKLRFPAIKSDVNSYQFFVVEALRIFDFSTYEVIQRNYKRGLQFGPKTISSDVDSLIPNENSKVLYNYLFEKNGGKQILYSVADPQFFDRYFALAISQFDVGENLVLQFVKDDRSRFYIIQQAIKDRRIKSLLKRISSISIDLDALHAVVRWPADSEECFLECRTEFIDAVAHIIEVNGDVAHGLNFLASILQGNDSHFNPAKFYLLFYFTSVKPSNMDKFFSKYSEMLVSHREAFKKSEMDVLKHYESDNLIFSRPSFKTDFFHRLFLKQYFSAQPLEYVKKLKTYFNQHDKALLFAGLLFQEYQGKTVVDPYWVQSLLNTDVLNELDSRIKEIKTQVLSSTNKSNFDLYQTHREEIRNSVNSLKDELS